MPRVTRVAKAQKAQGSCSKCGKKIAKGDPYIWWKFRFGGKRVRCAECPPKPSDLTQSEYLSQVYDLEERIGDINNDDPTAAISELESIADDWDYVEPVLVPEDGILHLRELVEDELILALPVVPVSPDSEAIESTCGELEPIEPQHPFAALAALKRYGEAGADPVLRHHQTAENSSRTVAPAACAVPCRHSRLYPPCHPLQTRKLA